MSKQHFHMKPTCFLNVPSALKEIISSLSGTFADLEDLVDDIVDAVDAEDLDDVEAISENWSQWPARFRVLDFL